MCIRDRTVVEPTVAGLGYQLEPFRVALDAGAEFVSLDPERLGNIQVALVQPDTGKHVESLREHSLGVAQSADLVRCFFELVRQQKAACRMQDLLVSGAVERSPPFGVGREVQFEAGVS